MSYANWWDGRKETEILLCMIDSFNEELDVIVMHDKDTNYL